MICGVVVKCRVSRSASNEYSVAPSLGEITVIFLTVRDEMVRRNDVGIAQPSRRGLLER